MSVLFDKPKLRFVGDTGLLLEYGDVIDPEVNRKVRIMTAAVDKDPPSGILEIIPTYRSLLMVYDPKQTAPERLASALTQLEQRLDRIEIPPPRTVEIPVLYGGEMGPDIGFVAEHTGLSIDEVIRRHSEPSYQIYMIGFTPGFAFLGGLPDELATPRLPTPRTDVPAGSVGIANNQTGMYPVTSPGGWRLIGRTPLKLFDPHREEPFLYQAGDLIKYRPMNQAEFDEIARGES
jgi:KipI family sensor histidine kinase inhibitor